MSPTHQRSLSSPVRLNASQRSLAFQRLLYFFVERYVYLCLSESSVNVSLEGGLL